jgi:hypothetical protein
MSARGEARARMARPRTIAARRQLSVRDRAEARMTSSGKGDLRRS